MVEKYVLELLPAQFGSFAQTREPKPTNKPGQYEADEEGGGRPVLKSLIDITTFHEHGPIPVAFTAPVVEVKKENDKEYTPYGTLGTAGSNLIYSYCS